MSQSKTRQYSLLFQAYLSHYRFYAESSTPSVFKLPFSQKLNFPSSDQEIMFYVILLVYMILQPISLWKITISIFFIDILVILFCCRSHIHFLCRITCLVGQQVWSLFGFLVGACPLISMVLVIFLGLNLYYFISFHGKELHVDSLCLGTKIYSTTGGSDLAISSLYISSIV